MDELAKLKAEVYDHLAAIEYHQHQIQTLNQRIAELSRDSAPKSPEIDVTPPAPTE